MKNLLFTSLLFFSIISLHAQKALKTGSRAPEFIATTTQQKNFDLKNIVKDKQVVLMFYRGQWCPYCNKQLSELQDSLKFITDESAVVIAITPEKPDQIDETIKKTGATFDIIYDKNHRIMDLYQVTFNLPKTKNTLYKSWGIDINKASGNDDLALPVPATYIINNKGIITGSFFDEDYKNRITVKEIVATLRLNKKNKYFR